MNRICKKLSDKFTFRFTLKYLGVVVGISARLSRGGQRLQVSHLHVRPLPRGVLAKGFGERLGVQHVDSGVLGPLLQQANRQLGRVHHDLNITVLKVYFPYAPVCRSISRLVGWSNGHNLL